MDSINFSVTPFMHKDIEKIHSSQWWTLKSSSKILCHPKIYRSIKSIFIKNRKNCQAAFIISLLGVLYNILLPIKDPIKLVDKIK
jgi:hypothetical protein